MMKAPLNRESTAIGFRSIARPKIEATLPIACFDDKQCDAIQNTYLMTFLAKMHQGREFIANGALENGAFCTVFSENFHKF
jgi:hypothetical protein